MNTMFSQFGSGRTLPLPTIETHGNKKSFLMMVHFIADDERCVAEPDPYGSLIVLGSDFVFQMAD